MAVDKGPSSNSNASDADGLFPAADVGIGAPSGLGRDEHAGEPDVALAWRLLSSPRTLLVLSLLLSLLFVIAAALPQRPTAAELARRLSFASADVATGLGLLDVMTAWPTLLLLLLVVLNLAGIFTARWIARAGPSYGGIVTRASALVSDPIDVLRARVAATPMKGRGLLREGAALAVLGVVALLIGFVIARGTALDARLELTPGARTLSEAVVRDGELFLPRTLPYGLMCERPDPQDVRRAFDCRLAGTGGTEPAQVFLAPGYETKVGDLALSPLRETLRTFSAEESYDFILTREGGADAAISPVERLRLEPGKSVALRASGQQLTAYAGPDGPLVVVEAAGARPVLLAPLADADAAMPTAGGSPPAAVAVTSAPSVLGDLHVAALTPTKLFVTVTSAPEWPLVLAGVLLIALGLLLMGLVPHVELALTTTTTGGTRVTIWSANRPSLPKRALLKVIAQSVEIRP